MTNPERWRLYPNPKGKPDSTGHLAALATGPRIIEMTEVVRADFLDDEALSRGLAAVLVTDSPDNREALRRALTSASPRERES